MTDKQHEKKKHEDNPSVVSKIMRFFYTLRLFICTQADLLMRIAALKKQLLPYKKEKPIPKVSRWDSFLWVWLRRIWKSWKNVLIIVKPDTVVSWHRKGFIIFWRFISERKKRKGQPPIDIEIIQLIHEMIERTTASIRNHLAGVRSWKSNRTTTEGSHSPAPVVSITNMSGNLPRNIFNSSDASLSQG